MRVEGLTNSTIVHNIQLYGQRATHYADDFHPYL